MFMLQNQQRAVGAVRIAEFRAVIWCYSMLFGVTLCYSPICFAIRLAHRIAGVPPHNAHAIAILVV